MFVLEGPFKMWKGVDIDCVVKLTDDLVSRMNECIV